MAIFEHFEQVAAIFGVGFGQSPVVEYQDLGSGESGQQFGVASVALGARLPPGVLARRTPIASFPDANFSAPCGIPLSPLRSLHFLGEVSGGAGRKLRIGTISNVFRIREVFAKCVDDAPQ